MQKFMRRRKYRVHAAFYNASLISTSMIDAPIEFEVSIGKLVKNYSNDSVLKKKIYAESPWNHVDIMVNGLT